MSYLMEGGEATGGESQLLEYTWLALGGDEEGGEAQYSSYGDVGVYTMAGGDESGGESLLLAYGWQSLGGSESGGESRLISAGWQALGGSESGGEAQYASYSLLGMHTMQGGDEEGGESYLDSVRFISEGGDESAGEGSYVIIPGYTPLIPPFALKQWEDAFGATDIRMGDVGAVLTISLGSDLSEATSRTIAYRKPSGRHGEWPAVIDSDVTKMSYTTVADDLDEAGVWQLQAYIEFTGGHWHSTICKMSVLPVLR